MIVPCAALAFALTPAFATHCILLDETWENLGTLVRVTWEVDLTTCDAPEDISPVSLNVLLAKRIPHTGIEDSSEQSAQCWDANSQPCILTVELGATLPAEYGYWKFQGEFDTNPDSTSQWMGAKALTFRDCVLATVSGICT